MLRKGRGREAAPFSFEVTMSGPDSFRTARPEDFEAIDAVLRAAFGGGAEVKLVRGLRAQGLIESEVVMPWGGGVVAHLALSRLVLPEGWLALAPVAVAPQWQGKGLGKRLLAGVMKLAAIKGQRVVVVGRPGFYAPLGFEFGGVVSRYPAGVSGVFGAAGGEVVYPAVFDGI
jgi:putative acetyltransferase